MEENLSQEPAAQDRHPAMPRALHWVTAKLSTGAHAAQRWFQLLPSPPRGAAVQGEALTCCIGQVVLRRQQRVPEVVVVVVR